MASGNISGLKILLANTYTLYLKTQNYHWNVTGANFIMLHKFFEEQYEALAEAVDTIAERIRILGANAPGSFEEFAKLKTLSEAQINLEAKDMIDDLIKDHTEINRTLAMLLEQAKSENDEVTQSVLVERLEYHEKAIWMLRSHVQ